MLSLLLDKKLNINGRGIYCKVTGEAGSANDGQPFFLMIQGGPGFDHYAVFSGHAIYARYFKGIQPHFIYFDPLGTGNSDQPQDKKSEYTVNNFTEITAKLIEAIKSELNIKQLDLRIYGRSFGSVIAMTLPSLRPEWTTESSSIQLRQIVSSSGPSKSSNVTDIMQFVEKHYNTDSNYDNIRRSVLKLLFGEIKDKEDYIRNIALTLAPLYSDKNATKLNNPLEKKLVVSHPMKTLALLHTMHSIRPTPSLNYILYNLEGCNHELLNYFFASGFDQLDLPALIRSHADIYRRIAICVVSSDLDYIANSESNAVPVTNALPHDIALIVLHAKHDYGADLPDTDDYINRCLLAMGYLDEDTLFTHKSVTTCYLPETFRQKLKSLKHVNESNINHHVSQSGIFRSSETSAEFAPSHQEDKYKFKT